MPIFYDYNNLMINIDGILNILIIEDDKVITSLLADGLSQYHNLNIQFKNNGKDGLEVALNQSFDLIILDLMLPELSGEEILKILREKNIFTPILVLSAKETVEDKVKGLSLGADDYLSKPFSINELVARIFSLTRRVSQFNPDAIIKIEDISIYLNKRKIYRSGVEIILQHNEFELLSFFIQNKNQILTKMQILKKIWGYDFDTQTNVVDVLVCRLRNKLEKNFSKKYIHTLRGLGYVFKQD